MKREKRSTSFILTALCTFALLLIMVGTSAFSFGRLPDGQNRIRNAAPHEAITPGTLATVIPGIIPTTMPGITGTETPGAVSTGTPAVIPTGTPGVAPTRTPNATTNPQGTYVGEVPNNHAWVALDSNGSQVMAFVTDGAKDHPATFAQWFKGTLENNRVTGLASKPDEGKVDALLTHNTATGIVTLPNGTTFPFTADVLPTVTNSGAPRTGAGLYRSEQMVNGQDYIGGWVLAPETNPTPSATETPSIVPPGTPSTILSPTAKPSISGIIQGGGLYNKQTDKVQSVPELTLQDLTAKKVSIPNLGEFKLTQCQQNLC